jgi:hypothetical protein
LLSEDRNQKHFFSSEPETTTLQANGGSANLDPPDLPGKSRRFSARAISTEAARGVLFGAT